MYRSGFLVLSAFLFYLELVFVAFQVCGWPSPYYENFRFWRLKMRFVLQLACMVNFGNT